MHARYKDEYYPHFTDKTESKGKFPHSLSCSKRAANQKVMQKTVLIFNSFCREIIKL